MKLDLANFARSGVVALGVLGACMLPSVAAPAGMAGSADISAPSQMALKPLLVQSTEPDMRGGSRDGFGGNWEENDWKRRHLRRNQWRNWDNGGYRRHYRPRSGIYFNFDLTPRHIEPRYVYPRRVYRSTGGSAHVNWCYNRYRSYRAWDNTFQPYNGPRQQCWSPYS